MFCFPVSGEALGLFWALFVALGSTNAPAVGTTGEAGMMSQGALPQCVIKKFPLTRVSA